MLKDLIELIINFTDKYKKGKSELFHNHIEPLKNQIHQIHKDYISSFAEAKRSLENKEIPFNDILKFLEQRREELSAERDLTKSIAAELQKADRKIVSPHTWEAFENFNTSVVNYFTATNSIARASWYSDFIHFMLVWQAIDSAHFFDQNAFGNDPRVDTIQHLDLLIGKKLPAALSEVNRNYAALRGALL